MTEWGADNPSEKRWIPIGKSQNEAIAVCDALNRLASGALGPRYDLTPEERERVEKRADEIRAELPSAPDMRPTGDDLKIIVRGPVPAPAGTPSEKCPVCHGKGFAGGAPYPCVHCAGQGWYVVPNRATGEPEQEQCAACYGTGRVGGTVPAPREPTANAPTWPTGAAQLAAYRVLWGKEPEYVSLGDVEERGLCARDEERWEEIDAVLRAAYAIDFGISV